MTARGAVLAMFAVFLTGTLLATWLGSESLVGVGFVAGCVLAAARTRRDSLLLVTATPAAVFLVALVCAQILTAQADSLRHTAVSVSAGTFLTLASAAPWLLGGTAAALVVATPRGLPQCVRELREGLRGY